MTLINTSLRAQRGKPHWKKLLGLAPATLSEEEQAFLDGPVETLCQMLDDWRITHDILDLPEDVWLFLKEKRFFSMIIPKQYGGLDFSTQAHSAVVVKIGSRSISAGCIGHRFRTNHKKF